MFSLPQAHRDSLRLFSQMGGSPSGYVRRRSTCLIRMACKGSGVRIPIAPRTSSGVLIRTLVDDVASRVRTSFRVTLSWHTRECAAQRQAEDVERSGVDLLPCRQAAFRHRASQRITPLPHRSNAGQHRASGGILSRRPPPDWVPAAPWRLSAMARR